LSIGLSNDNINTRVGIPSNATIRIGLLLSLCGLVLIHSNNIDDNNIYEIIYRNDMNNT
jgi:hypothetical protein